MEDKGSNPFARLTAREHEVLRIIARELKSSESPKQAAEQKATEIPGTWKSKLATKK